MQKAFHSPHLQIAIFLIFDAMKFFCLILSLSVMLLSTMPCCGDDDCDDEKMATEQTDNHNNTDETCSPFLTCGVCTGFVSLFEVFIFPAPLEQKIVNVNSGIILFVDNCFTTIWQPPKMVNT